MRVTRTNGEIIDCTVSEYLLLKSSEKFAEAVEKIIADSKDGEKDKVECEAECGCECQHKTIPHNYREAFEKAFKPKKVEQVEKVEKVENPIKTKISATVNKGVGSGRGKRISSCQPWTKKEDIIILNNDIRTAITLLPNRTYSAIKSRLKKFHSGGLRKPQNVKANDYRKTMMTWVSHKARELQDTQGLTHTAALKKAMELYKLQYASQHKRVND